MNKQMISWRQAFMLIFISYMLVALTYIPSGETTVRNVDKLISIFFSMLIVSLFFLPVYFLTKQNKDCNVIDCVQREVKFLTKPVALFYSLAFSYIVIVTISRFSLFITSVLLVESKTAIFIIIILVAACYAAFLGIEAISRASLFVFTILIVSMVFSCFVLVEEVDFINFRPFFYNGVFSIFGESFIDASRLIEAAILGVLAPKIAGGIKKTVITFVIVFWISVTLLTFLVISVLGEYSAVQLFPVYTLVSLARIGNFHRFDAILSGVWIAGDFIKAAVLISVSGECMKYVAKGRKHRVLMVLSVLVIFAFSMFASRSFEDYLVVSNYIVTTVVTTTASVIIPLVFLIIGIIKKKKRNRSECQCQRE